jgi:D-alanyl-D-alanine carboxypeptidase
MARLDVEAGHGSCDRGPGYAGFRYAGFRYAGFRYAGFRYAGFRYSVLRYSILGLTATAAALTISSDAADARHHHRAHVHYVHLTRVHHAGHGRRHHVHDAEYAPPGSSIVIDGNSGAVLEASNPDALRHPASLTKVMTLYLLFERLDAGKIRLDTPLKVSEHAAEQAPTKLELKPGSTISVEDAIRGIVTKSANDAAVAVAENLGGDEETFAKMMTQKAHALGMTRTTYVNASGLPDDDQVTTARDQALLGRAIQDRFPRYYKYFQTETFVYHGEAMRNHNHLLGAVEGVDGIKTGFTRASGFNLLTSVHRDGRFLVAVVMGGHSAFERDAHMRELIADHLKEASLRRTAPMIAEGNEREQPVAFAKASMVSAPMVSHADPTPTSSASRIAAAVAAANDNHVAGGANDPIRPLLVKTITFRTAPVQTASLSPMPTLVAVAPQPAPPQIAPPKAAPQAGAQPAQVPPAVAPQVPAQVQAQGVQAQTVAASAEQPRAIVASADRVAPVQVAAPQAVAALAAPAAAPVQTIAAPVAPVAAPAAPVATPVAQPVQTAAAMPEPAYTAQTALPRTKAPVAVVSPVHAHSGWMIQIGAFDDEDQAKQHLTAAQAKVHAALAAADPFTERVQKGDKALYRARFAGFDKSTAETACKELKRSDFQCMTLKD